MANTDHRGPVTVPTPTAPGHAANKQFVEDAVAAGGGGGGAPAAHASTHASGGSDPVTPAAIGALALTARGAASGVAELDAASRVPTNRQPIVAHGVRSGSVSSSVTSDASSGAGNLVNLQITGNVTINAPTNPVDWQTFEHHMVAVGADRTVTFAGGYVPGGAGLGPYTVPRGKVLIAKSVYVGNRATAADAAAPAWALVSVDITDAVTGPAAHTASHAPGGSDPLTGYALTTRQVLAGTGLSGGGDLSADRTLSVAYGATAGTAVQGNDSRVTADQAVGTASIRTLGTGAQQAAAGDHAHAGVHVLPAPRIDGGDDSVVVNAFISSTPIGAVITAPGGAVYNCATTVVLQPYRRYALGPSWPNTLSDPPGTNRLGTIFRMAAGANLDRLVATAAVMGTSASPVPDGSLQIDGLIIDGNRANQTGGMGIGLALATQLGIYRNITIYNTRGHGILLPRTNAGGNAFTVGVENHFGGTIKITGCGGHGFWAQDTWTDVTISGLFVASICGLAGIKVDNGAGWNVQGAHIWAVGTDGILIQAAYACHVDNCYVEGFGAAHSSSGAGVPSTYGTYAAGTTYSMYALVVSGGGLYYSLADGNTGNTPASSPTLWAPVNPGNSAVYGIGCFAIGYPRPLHILGNTVSVGHVGWATIAGINYRGFIIQSATSGASYVHFRGNVACNEMANGQAATAMAFRVAVQAGGALTVAGMSVGGSGVQTNTKVGTWSQADSMDASVTNWSPLPDATSAIKGVVQLAGDLGGTAAAPTVPGLASRALSSRQIITGTGLTGGGDLSADRTLAVVYGSSAGTAAQGNDSRLSDTRTPTDSSVTDAKVAAGAAIAESKLALASDAAAGTASRRTLGTGALQAAAGNHTHADVPTTRQVIAGTGLTGGGALSADVTLAVAYGTGAGTAAQGNDSRITGALQASVATTKGDLLVATASATIARLGVGTDGQVLTADSTQASGVKWAAAAGGGGADATTTSKGIVQLAGDLAGTAAAPTVPGLANKVNTSAVGAANGVCPLDSNGYVSPGSQYGAGTGNYGIIQLAGDLGGTAAAPTVPGLANKLDILGPISTKTANYTLSDADAVVVFNTASAAMTATLPTAVGRTGRRFMIKKLGGSTANALTIATTASQTIDGATTEVISLAGGFRELISDGANWHILGGKIEPVTQALANVGAGGTINIDAAIGSVYRVTTTGGTATLAVPTNPIDADAIDIEITANVALTLTINASILLTTGIATPINVPANKKLFLKMRTISTTWYLLAATIQN